MRDNGKTKTIFTAFEWNDKMRYRGSKNLLLQF
jgi:hypothetical protein